MADPAPPKPASTMSGNQFTRKLGPLPVWAWAALVLVAYYAYNRYQHSTSTPPGSDGAGSDGSGAYVPGFDSPSRSAYNTPGGSQITNNYYGDQNAGQAGGGGTSNGTGGAPGSWGSLSGPGGGTGGGSGTGGGISSGAWPNFGSGGTAPHIGSGGVGWQPIAPV